MPAHMRHADSDEIFCRLSCSIKFLLKNPCTGLNLYSGLQGVEATFIRKWKTNRTGFWQSRPAEVWTQWGRNEIGERLNSLSNFPPSRYPAPKTEVFSAVEAPPPKHGEAIFSAVVASRPRIGYFAPL
eukprot:4765851-Pleurochrysis_carterae.AAC.1